MCHYHSISVNRKGTIAHVYWNSHAEAVYQKKWAENTRTRIYHWDFEYDPAEGPYPGALECTNRNIYAQEPTKRVLDAVDEHYHRLIALHNGDYSYLEYFAGDNYSDVRETTAQKRDIPVEVLIRLVSDPDKWVRRHAIANPNTPMHLLEKCAKSINMYEKSGVALNPNTPPGILAKLAEDESLFVKHAVASNCNTPASTLHNMAKDESVLTKVIIACNPSTRKNTLMQLAENEDMDLRSQVARNQHTSNTVLDILLSDKFS